MRAKKHLGQHFLHEKGVLKAIRDTVDPTGNSIVLEIGPGTGNLTAELLPLAGKVIAIEKDPDMVAALRERFSRHIAEGTLEILEQDALAFDPETLRFYKDHDYILCGNIPYNITGALLEHYLSARYQPKRTVFLMQREVAERIVAGDGKESILSLSVKAFGVPKIIQRVGKGAFTPAPKVESVILAIEPALQKRFKSHDTEELFFEIVRHGFAHKRKTIRKNLSEYFTSDFTTTMLDRCAIDPQIRPEDIHLDAWLALTDFVYNSGSDGTYHLPAK